jgi:glycosyltransferase involved in cell wall biosynthesis
MRIVMFVRNDVTVDARVLKEAGTLTDAGHDVTIVGTSRPDGPPGVEREQHDGIAIVRVPLPNWRRWWRWLRAPSRLWSMIRRRSIHARPGERMDGLDWVAMWRFGTLGWARAAAREAGPADAYHGHDLSGLPAAVCARRLHAGHLVYDSHELYIESASTAGRPSWAVDWLARRERAWSAGADAIVTVNDALAEDLGPRLSARRVVVVYNCPPRPGEEPVTSGDQIRTAASIPSGAPIAVYTGGLRPGRGLEQAAAAMLEPGLEEAHLAFLGFGPLREDLVALAAEPRFGGSLHVLDPVGPLEVVPWVASADVAVVPIQRHNRSYELSTPNKLFEAMAAGVPVVASDFAGMRGIVAGIGDGPLGELCDPADPASIAAAMRRLLELPAAERRQIGLRGHRAARERWNWEVESAKLVDMYRDLEAAR